MRLWLGGNKTRTELAGILLVKVFSNFHSLNRIVTLFRCLNYFDRQKSSLAKLKLWGNLSRVGCARTRSKLVPPRKRYLYAWIEKQQKQKSLSLSLPAIVLPFLILQFCGFWNAFQTPFCSVLHLTASGKCMWFTIELIWFIKLNHNTFIRLLLKYSLMQYISWLICYSTKWSH